MMGQRWDISDLSSHPHTFIEICSSAGDNGFISDLDNRLRGMRINMADPVGCQELQEENCHHHTGKLRNEQCVTVWRRRQSFTGGKGKPGCTEAGWIKMS